jgi:hypothetical protein
MCLISDVPNTAENLLLQVAIAHIGATIVTPPKDAAALQKLCQTRDVRGVVCVDGTAPPLSEGLADPLPTVTLETSDGLRPPAGTVSFSELLIHCPPRGAPPSATAATALGVYGVAELSHGAAMALGRDAAARLVRTGQDRVCCSVTLMHAFGIGSAVTSALSVGAAVVLPAVGGIRGCGDPGQRAEVTREVLAATGATVLFGDTHTLRALVAMGTPPTGLNLRTGVIKIASGSTFLEGVSEAPAPKGGEALALEYAGVRMHAMGKA